MRPVLAGALAVGIRLIPALVPLGLPPCADAHGGPFNHWTPRPPQGPPALHTPTPLRVTPPPVTPPPVYIIWSDNYWLAWWFSGNRETFLPFGTPATAAPAGGTATVATGLDPAVAQVLREAAGDDNLRVRMMAAMALGDAGFEDQHDVVLRLMTDEKEDVRATAYLAAGMIHATAMLAPLRAAVEDANERPRVRGYAAVGLGFLAEFAARQPATASAGEEARAVLASALGNGDAPPELLVGALSGAERAKAVALLPAIEKITGHRNPDVACGAITALGKIGDPKSLPFLLKLLGDESSVERRQSAYIALGCFADQGDEFLGLQILDALLPRLSAPRAGGERDTFSSNMILIALARLGRADKRFQPRVYIELAKVLTIRGARSIEERGFAALALGILLSGATADERLACWARALLRGRLAGSERNDTVRGALCTALGLLKDERARPVLQRLARDQQEGIDNYEIRAYALCALAFIGNVEDALIFHDILYDRKDSKRKDVVWNTLIALGVLYRDRDLPPVFEGKLLCHPTGEIRAAVCVGLGVGRNRRALPLLAERYRTEENDFVRVELVAALGALGSKYGGGAWSCIARDHNFRVNGTQLGDLY